MHTANWSQHSSIVGPIQHQHRGAKITSASWGQYNIASWGQHDISIVGTIQQQHRDGGFPSIRSTHRQYYRKTAREQFCGPTQQTTEGSLRHHRGDDVTPPEAPHSMDYPTPCFDAGAVSYWGNSAASVKSILPQHHARHPCNGSRHKPGS